MKIMVKIALMTGALALAFGSAALAAGPPEGVPPHGKGVANGNGPGDATPGPRAGLPAKAKAYGRHCKGESKQHVEGEKGTAFSRCVRDVVALRKRERQEAREAAEGDVS